MKKLLDNFIKTISSIEGFPRNVIKQFELFRIFSKTPYFTDKYIADIFDKFFIKKYTHINYELLKEFEKFTFSGNFHQPDQAILPVTIINVFHKNPDEVDCTKETLRRLKVIFSRNNSHGFNPDDIFITRENRGIYSRFTSSLCFKVFYNFNEVKQTYVPTSDPTKTDLEELILIGNIYMYNNPNNWEVLKPYWS